MERTHGKRILKRKKNFYYKKKVMHGWLKFFWRMASEDHIASVSSSSKSFFIILSPSRLVSTGRPGCRNRNQDRVGFVGRLSNSSSSFIRMSSSDPPKAERGGKVDQLSLPALVLRCAGHASAHSHDQPHIRSSPWLEHLSPPVAGSSSVA